MGIGDVVADFIGRPFSSRVLDFPYVQGGASQKYPPPAAVAVCGVASAYVICGRLGLLLAVPPGFATAVFLPAGFAVTAMFIAGSASLPGTFLGSFLLNVWISYSIKHQLDVVGVNAALIIALSSTIQAAAGGALLRKLIGYPAFFDNLRIQTELTKPLPLVIGASFGLHPASFRDRCLTFYCRRPDPELIVSQIRILTRSDVRLWHHGLR